MTSEDQEFIFNHIKKSILPISENRIKQVLKSEIAKVQIKNNNKLKEMKKLEKYLDNKIKIIKDLNQESDKKLVSLLNAQENKIDITSEIMDCINIDLLTDKIIAKLEG